MFVVFRLFTLTTLMLTFERELAFAFAFEDTLGFLVTLRLDAGMNEAAVEAATAVALAVTLALDRDRDRKSVV